MTLVITFNVIGIAFLFAAGLCFTGFLLGLRVNVIKSNEAENRMKIIETNEGASDIIEGVPQ